MNKKFLVLPVGIVPSGQPRYWEFNTPHEVAIFMWGRNFRHYQIYIRAVDMVAASADPEIFKLREALKDVEDKIYA
jgi:hypothetical protein